MNDYVIYTSTRVVSRLMHRSGDSAAGTLLVLALARCQGPSVICGKHQLPLTSNIRSALLAPSALSSTTILAHHQAPAYDIDNDSDDLANKGPCVDAGNPNTIPFHSPHHPTTIHIHNPYTQSI